MPFFVSALLSLAVAAGASSAGAEVWSPAPGTSWQWQLQGRLDTSVDADVYDVDAFDTKKGAVADLHTHGRRVICYVNVGAWERWRPDASRFPRSLLGRKLDGWAGERWLDIRRLGALKPILRARLDRCRRKGFDAVEPDNIDGYANDSGFPLRPADQLRFNRFVASAAHARGLGVALKNDLDQAEALQPAFDFAIVEECFRYRECGLARPFTKAGNAVLVAEYDLPRSSFCGKARRLGFSAMRKHLSLGAWRRVCRAQSRRARRNAEGLTLSPWP